jgi:mitogen-activated protein kinase organizer 1
MLIFTNTELSCDCYSCVDGSIRIYDIRMGTLITDRIFGEFLAPFLMCSNRRWYFVRKFQYQHIVILIYETEPVTSVSFSKDGNCVLASSLDDTLRLMDRANGTMLNAYKGHTNNKYKIRSCLSNSDAYVLSGSEDGSIYIWDLLEAS